ncbi:MULTISPECIES: hypothetical protein [Streptomyces]|uniref:C2H2-type domain-containing protein n=2 Tax=Streptomyces TaxID=1883 RepID=A0ABS9J804_9ACTN|nr:hypothetical protein [Streptomyces tricolor]MCG0061690.1 hypothetical protein [Streptomyces tricolor]MYU30662.1 hypothetical protein [Streptomyces sp. SID7810]CUW31736.1 hypothetical protein TUE45_06485 [Streptomyces reticuli]
MSADFISELCPHCEQPQPASETDQHIATVHADIPPCTARLNSEHGVYTCVLRAGHRSAHGEHGDYHVSARGPVGRTIWNDNATGASPHHAEEQPA